MQLKKKTISFLWLTGLCRFVILGALDLLGEGRIQWTHYLWLGLGIEMVIVTGAIELLSHTCPQCGTMLLFDANYCNRCGENLLMKKQAYTQYELASKKELQTKKTLPELEQK